MKLKINTSTNTNFYEYTNVLTSALSNIRQMKKNYILTIFYAIIFLFSETAMAQNPTPALPQSKSILLINGIAHLGNGLVIENSAIGFKDGKLTLVADATTLRLAAGAYDTTINCGGKHIYPGFIALNTELGLREIELVRSTNDQTETGKLNPSSRTAIAYNTDSKVIPTVRNNGVLLAQVCPNGGIISGSSSVVELDAWNWEDATYKMDEGIHLNFPSLRIYGSGDAVKDGEQVERSQKNITDLKTFFSQAKAYSLSQPEEKNLHFESMRGLFDKSKKLYIRCNDVKEIIAAINFCKEFGMQMVLVGGNDAWRITNLLLENNIPVIINKTHNLPSRDDEEVNMPYQLPAMLHNKGVQVAIANDGYWQVRNLGFQAGTSVAHGLPKEKALEAITLTPAKILGIDNTVGSIEQNKDATLFISSGDALDMLGNKVEMAFIRGKQIDLDDVQKQLYRKYMSKYGLKE
jgi:imidazolonepropionase-like amidohydrolase